MEKDNFEKQLYSITTIILTEGHTENSKFQGNASGFYYTITTPTDPSIKGPHWEEIKGYWLITNRHVILPQIEGKEVLIDSLTFCLREINDGKIDWLPIVLTQSEIKKRTKLHEMEQVDVVAIDVTDCIHDRIIESAKSGKNNLMIPTTLTNSNLPDNQPITIDVTSDIIVASYPKGFYDVVNKFPIVKSGIVASGWGLNFRGNPLFEIDAQLFPGSSGGVVISKPQNIAMIDGRLNYSKTKQYVFLGVYSGEYMWKDKVKRKDGSEEEIDRSYGLGNVWYSYLIPEIIDGGRGLYK